MINKLTKMEKYKMKISTAEIKILIKECVKTYGMYTASDFRNYIIKKVEGRYKKPDNGSN